MVDFGEPEPSRRGALAPRAMPLRQRYDARRKQPGGVMVQLVDSDIKTREVLGWKGVHVLHFAGSSCSQKLRIFLNLKGIPWESHPIDLPGNENFRPWFLGINPRGLVPVLVHDGAVHIESNDIIQYLEKTFPEPKLIPAGPRERGRGAAQARGRSASRSAHLELPFRVRAARPAEAGRGAGELRRERLRHRAGRAGIATRTSRSSSGSAPPRKASPTSGRAPRRRNSAPSSMRSTSGWRSRPI